MKRALPSKLRAWAKKKREEDEQKGTALPSPSNRYWELEACKAFHYPGLAAWETEHPFRKEELIAHEMEHSLREAYAVSTAAEKTTAPNTANPLDAMRRRMGLR